MPRHIDNVADELLEPAACRQDSTLVYLFSTRMKSGLEQQNKTRNQTDFLCSLSKGNSADDEANPIE
jgi:hypothetical protein